MKNILTRITDFLWLGGPIFTKELIVSSRRRRNYFVRFAYPALLAFFVVSYWMNINNYSGSTSAILQVARMAQAGIQITTVVVWFQFIVVQVLAVIMLSTAISDEIYHKTLGVLMTTPISSFQIVFSKLLSKLYQLILILGISLPLLAIIRVFGGVPWSYVLSSLCITLTASIFAGTLSLLFSIYSRQSQLVVTRTILTCFFIYAMPMIAYRILQSGLLGATSVQNLIPALGLFFINPFMLMLSMTATMHSASGVIDTGVWLWPCAAMLGLSAIVLMWSSICVRKAGLRQITGQAGMFLTRKERRIAAKKQRMIYSNTLISGKIRDIKWPPIIWREVANPLLKQNRIGYVFGIGLAVTLLIAAYGLCIYFGVLTSPGTQIVFALIYYFIALVRTSTFASTSITSEKESRTWPILLTSPLTGKEISFQKIIGSCLRAWPYWSLLVTHLFVFILLGTISVLIIIPLSLLFASSVLLVSAIGVMFSSICKRSSTSSSLNIISFLLFVSPVCCVPLFIGSPIFAALAIFAKWAGFSGGGDSFGFLPPSADDGLWSILFSSYFFIFYVIVYLLLALAAYAISVNHIRWRIL